MLPVVRELHVHINSWQLLAVKIHRVQKKVVYFVFERNFTTTGSIFLQFSVTITKYN